MTLASKEQLAILKQGVDVWNKWRIDNPSEGIDLIEANLRGANLRGANLSGADLYRINLREANLYAANLGRANLTEANLIQANLIQTNLNGAILIEGDLFGANLSEAKLIGASLNGANLTSANLKGVNLIEANLTGAYLNEANLSGANLSNANLSGASLIKAHLSRAVLREAVLNNAVLSGADLSEAKLAGASLDGANLRGANLRGANFVSAELKGVNLAEADLSRANLRKAYLEKADLSGANLSSANMKNAHLENAVIIGTNIQHCILKDCRIYGISVWDPKGIPADESGGLIITPHGQPEITVDNLKVAQFVYLLLNNEEIRDVLDTIGKKGVLILGRFTPGRKQVLDALRVKLRMLNFVPMMFDFEGASTKDFTETVKILAGLCRFIIADITSPKSSPLELQATVPDYKVPFLPIIQEGEEPFSMFANLQIYPWMLDLLEYKDSNQLADVFEKAIMLPAQIKADEINLQKAEQVRKRYAKDYQ